MGFALSGNAGKGRRGMTTADKRARGVETTGIEPATSWLQTVPVFMYL
jgi:hypothetical protein